MMQQRKPVTYQDWLNELYNNHSSESIIGCAVEVAKRAPDKKTAFHDVSLVLAQMYNRDMVKAKENPIIEREIKTRFNDVTTTLFKTDFDKVLHYVITAEPQFDPGAAKAVIEDKKPLGFIKASAPSDPDRKPLGFIKTTPRNGNPSLGFMD